MKFTGPAVVAKFLRAEAPIDLEKVRKEFKAWRRANIYEEVPFPGMEFPCKATRVALIEGKVEEVINGRFPLRIEWRERVFLGMPEYEEGGEYETGDERIQSYRRLVDFMPLTTERWKGFGDYNRERYKNLVTEEILKNGDWIKDLII